MDELTRREMMTAVGYTAVSASNLSETPESTDLQDKQKKAAPTADQQFVMKAGMTRQEAECWKLIAEAAGAFFALPEMHQMDRQEVSNAIHIIQNKLLSRPTYRKYLELAKAARGKK